MVYCDCHIFLTRSVTPTFLCDFNDFDDFDVMTRASFLDRVITMQLDSKYRRHLVFCQSVVARKSP